MKKGQQKQPAKKGPAPKETTKVAASKKGSADSKQPVKKIEKPPPEPPKPKENLRLKRLKQIWESMILEPKNKQIFEKQQKFLEEPFIKDIKQGSKQINSVSQNIDSLNNKWKSDLIKSEIQEGLIHMRMRQNIITKNEWDQKQKLIKDNFLTLADNKDKIVEKLGIQSYLANRTLSMQNIDSKIQASLSCLIPSNELKTARVSPVNILNLNGPSKANNGSVTQRAIKKQEVNLIDQKKHEEIIKKIKQQQKFHKDLHNKIIAKHEKIQKKKEEIEIVQKEEKEKKTKDEVKKKYLETQEKLSKLQKEREQIKQSDSISKAFLKEYKPLSIKLEEKYLKEVELPALEQKKKQFEELRNFYAKPFDKNDILLHEQKYKSITEEKQKEREVKIKEFKEDLIKKGNKRYEINKHVEEELKKQEEDQLQLENKRKQLEKMNQYAMFVKEEIWGSSDNFKSGKRISSPEETRKQIKTSSSVPRFPSIQKSARDAANSVALSARNIQSQRGSIKEEDSILKSKKINWKSDFTIKKEKEKEIDKIKEEKLEKLLKRDYLKEAIEERDANIREGKEVKIDGGIGSWQKALTDKNLTDRERYDMVKLKADQLQEMAELEEKLTGISDEHVAIEKAQKANDLYIEALKAKIEMLNNYQTSNQVNLYMRKYNFLNSFNKLKGNCSVFKSQERTIYIVFIIFNF